MRVSAADCDVHFGNRAKALADARGKSNLAGWFAPDLAMTAAMISVIYLVVFFGGATAMFRDSDAGWHILAGERMLNSGSLPHSDPFSFSKPGAPWIPWEWLSDVLVAGAHKTAGLNGVATLYALTVGASVWMWFRLNWAAGGNFLLACLFASPLLSTTNLHWLARPHIFSWLFLVGTVWCCERMPVRVTAVHLTAVAMVTALWANMHGSFFLGPAIALLYGFGAWLRCHIWDGKQDSSGRYYLVAAAAAVGSLLNPYGWQLHRHVLAYLSDSELLDRIEEFQSFNFHAAGSTQIIFTLLVGMAGGFAALSARQPARFLLAMALTAGALRTARMLPLAALLLLPLANGSISLVLSRVELAARLRRRLDAALSYGRCLRTLDERMHGLALVPLCAVVLFAVMRLSHAGFPADQFPVSASAAVKALPPNARLFAPDKFGGYLIYRFGGERKVFFDGRSDFYGAAFLRRYSRIVQVRPGWEEEFLKWGFTHALLPVDYSLIPGLEAQGWTELYRDRTAVLLASPVKTISSVKTMGEPKA